MMLKAGLGLTRFFIPPISFQLSVPGKFELSASLLLIPFTMFLNFLLPAFAAVNAVTLMHLKTVWIFMPYFNLKFSNTDNELANFAKALALPVRIAIVRIIMTNGNSVSKESLYAIPFNHETITKHLSELKRMGMIKARGFRGSIKYSLDEQLFRQMASGFTMLFESMKTFEHDLQDC
jgi:hypothetical protein